MLGRYGLDEIRSLLTSLVRRSATVTAKMPFYDKMRRRRGDTTELLCIGPADVVIIDGTIALSLLDPVPASTSHSWFVEVDEDERHLRVLREYRLRGFSGDEAETVYRTRQRDETPAILATSGLAGQRISLNLAATTSHEADRIKGQRT